jgi:hypothetical protein
MERPVVDYEFVDGIMVIYIPKGILALTPNDVKICLRRGKRIKHRTKLEMRLSAQLGDSEFKQASQAVTGAGGNDNMCEREAELDVLHRAKEGIVTPLVLTFGPVSLTLDPPHAAGSGEPTSNRVATGVSESLARVFR